ncbi:uncharacterized protein LOC144111318 isoform X2 [Amblyomma americanum]
MLVSVEDVRILRAVDKLLSKYSAAALMDHLSLWVVQILTVLGWPQGFRFIAGSREVFVWPRNVAESNETLWRSYAKFFWSSLFGGEASTTAGPQSAADTGDALLMDHWMHVSASFWELSDEQRERMQLLWQSDELEFLRHEPWTNRLRVSHAALRSPLFYPGSAELRKANFGGLGAAFFQHMLRTSDPPDEGMNASLGNVPWPELAEVRHRAESLRCGPEFLPHLLDIAALGLAWHAVNSATQLQPSETDNIERAPDPALLAIRDDQKEEHLYTEDQLFFLTYCRSRCRKKTAGNRRDAGCNAAVRSMRHFGRSFNCHPGSPMFPRDTCEISDFF